MRTLLLLLLSCFGAIGQGEVLFPGPGNPIQLDSTRLYPAIVSGGGSTIIVTNASFTYLTNNVSYITNLYVSTVTNNIFATTNITVYDSVVIQTNLTVKQNFNLSGKAQLNLLIITNGFLAQTNLWSGPSNNVDATIYDQELSSFTACQFNGFINTSNSLQSEVKLTIANAAGTNFNVTAAAGFIWSGGATSATITNGHHGIFWLNYNPALGGSSNIVWQHL